MNSKSELVSADRLIAVTKKNYENITEVEWDSGIIIKVKANLSLSETASFVAVVTDYCFGEDGEYHPEFMDFAMQYAIATIYGNIELPEDAEEQYDLLCMTGVCDHILQYVNKAQFKELVKAIDRKLKYMTDSNIIQVRNEVSKFADVVLELRDRLESSMSKFGDLDLKRIVEQISSFDAEKALKSVIEKKQDETQKDEPTKVVT